MERIYVCRVIVGLICVIQYLQWTVQQQNVFSGNEGSNLFKLGHLSEIIKVVQHGQKGKYSWTNRKSDAIRRQYDHGKI